MTQKPFSQDLEAWLSSNKPKTLDSLLTAFGEKSFATIFILCMALPSLPIPTGGITHVLEVIVVLFAAQTAVGLKSLWVPGFLRKRAVPKSIITKALPVFIKQVKKLETYSRRRGTKFMTSKIAEPLAGIMVIAFALGAFFAPPFSGLDTIVSLGAVILSLGIVLEDTSFYVAGIITGLVGLAVEILFGAVVAKAVTAAWKSGSGKIIVLSLAVLLVGFVVVHLLKKHK